MTTTVLVCHRAVRRMPPRPSQLAFGDPTNESRLEELKRQLQAVFTEENKHKFDDKYWVESQSLLKEIRSMLNPGERALIIEQEILNLEHETEVLILQANEQLAAAAAIDEGNVMAGQGLRY